MKIICQNCYNIIAERNRDENTLRYDPNLVDSLIQPIGKDEVLLTLLCPHCGCALQIKG